MSCGAPAQDAALPAGVDTGNAAIVQGRVCAAGEPVAGAFVRLLDGTGEFTAEVVTSAEGRFRFFAADGEWTVRALSRVGNGSAPVLVSGNGLYPVEVAVSA